MITWVGTSVCQIFMQVGQKLTQDTRIAWSARTFSASWNSSRDWRRRSRSLLISNSRFSNSRVSTAAMRQPMSSTFCMSLVTPTTARLQSATVPSPGLAQAPSPPTPSSLKKYSTLLSLDKLFPAVAVAADGGAARRFPIPHPHSPSGARRRLTATCIPTL